jgi:hypothetical protein
LARSEAGSGIRLDFKSFSAAFEADKDDEDDDDDDGTEEEEGARIGLLLLVLLTEVGSPNSTPDLAGEEDVVAASAAAASPRFEMARRPEMFAAADIEAPSPEVLATSFFFIFFRCSATTVFASSVNLVRARARTDVLICSLPESDSAAPASRSLPPLLPASKHKRTACRRSHMRPLASPRAKTMRKRHGVRGAADVGVDSDERVVEAAAS